MLTVPRPPVRPLLGSSCHCSLGRWEGDDRPARGHRFCLPAWALCPRLPPGAAAAMLSVPLVVLRARLPSGGQGRWLPVPAPGGCPRPCPAPALPPPLPRPRPRPASSRFPAPHSGSPPALLAGGFFPLSHWGLGRTILLFPRVLFLRPGHLSDGSRPSQPPLRTPAPDCLTQGSRAWGVGRGAWGSGVWVRLGPAVVGPHQHPACAAGFLLPRCRRRLPPLPPVIYWITRVFPRCRARSAAREHRPGGSQASLCLGTS